MRCTFVMKFTLRFFGPDGGPQNDSFFVGAGVHCGLRLGDAFDRESGGKSAALQMRCV
jgi:hypothetical protein